MVAGWWTGLVASRPGKGPRACPLSHLIKPGQWTALAGTEHAGRRHRPRQRHHVRSHIPTESSKQGRIDPEPSKCKTEHTVYHHRAASVGYPRIHLISSPWMGYAVTCGWPPAGASRRCTILAVTVRSFAFAHLWHGTRTRRVATRFATNYDGRALGLPHHILPRLFTPSKCFLYMQRQRCGLLVPLDVAQQLLGFLAAADRAALRLTAKHMMSASPPPGTVVRVHLATRRSAGAPWLDAKRRAVLTAEAAASSPQRHWRRSATIHTVRLVEYRPRPAVFGLATREPLAFEDDEARALAGWVYVAFARLVVPHWVPACHFGSANVVFDRHDGRVTPGPLWKARHSPTEAAITVMPGGRLTIWEPDEDDEVHDAWLRSIPWIDTQSSVVPASHQTAVAFPGVRTRLVTTVARGGPRVHHLGRPHGACAWNRNHVPCRQARRGHRHRDRCPTFACRVRRRLAPSAHRFGLLDRRRTR